MLDLLRNIALGSDSPYRYRTVPIAAPGNGQQFTATVPGGKVWLPLGVNAILTTSAVAGTRTPALAITDGTAIVALIASSAFPLASEVTAMSWVLGASNAGQVGAVGTVTVDLPPLPLPAGFQIVSSAGAFDGGDHWNSIFIWILETDRESLLERLTLPNLQWTEGTEPPAPVPYRPTFT